MADENTDLQNTDEAVTEAQISAEAANEALAAGEPKADQAEQLDDAAKGQLKDLIAERQKRQELERQFQQTQQRAAQLEAFIVQSRAQQQAQQTAPAGDLFGQLADDEYPTVGQLRQAMTILERKTTAQQFLSSNNDFAEVVGVTDPLTGIFTPAEPLRQLFTEDPGLQQLILSSPNPPALAYKLGKSRQKIMAMEAEKLKAQEILTKADATTAPMSPAAVGGGAAALKVSGQIGNMSEEEFQKLDQIAATTM